MGQGRWHALRCVLHAGNLDRPSGEDNLMVANSIVATSPRAK